MKRIAIALAMTLTAALAQGQATAEQQAQLQERMATVAERLALTDEQKAAIQPIMADSLAQQHEILAKYGIDPQTMHASKRPNPRQAMKLRQEMDVARQATQGQLEDILDDDQMAEFARIQEEAKADMRNRIRGGR